MSYDIYGTRFNSTIPSYTTQYPTAIPYHSYGMLNCLRSTPPQFFPSQEPIYSDMGVNAKHQYLRTAHHMKKETPNPLSLYNYSSNTRTAISGHTNYIAPVQSSMYVNVKKSIAIGKSIYSPVVTTKNYYPSGSRSSLRRARSSGCVAPKKKGAY